MLAGFPPFPCWHFLLPHRQCCPLFTRSLCALGSRDICDTPSICLPSSFGSILQPSLCRSFPTGIASFLSPLSTLGSRTRLLAYMGDTSARSSVWHFCISLRLYCTIRRSHTIDLAQLLIKYSSHRNRNRGTCRRIVCSSLSSSYLVIGNAAISK